MFQMPLPIIAPIPLRVPAIVGSVVGVLLALGIAAFAPATELRSGDSRIIMAVVGALFLVPASIGTAYFARLALNNVRKMPRLGFVWIGASLFFTFAVGVGVHSDWTATRQYAREGQSTQGVVIEPHPEDHNRILVAYTVSGVDYRGRFEGPKNARSYNSGEVVEVHYFASAPGQPFGVEPRWRPAYLFTAWVVAAGVLPIWAVGLTGVVWLAAAGRGPRGATLDHSPS